MKQTLLTNRACFSNVVVYHSGPEQDKAEDE